MKTDGVTTAFDTVLEELAKVLGEVNIQCQQFTSESRYDEATRLIESGREIQKFKERLNSLLSEWKNGLDSNKSNR